MCQLPACSDGNCADHRSEQALTVLCDFNKVTTQDIYHYGWGELHTRCEQSSATNVSESIDSCSAGVLELIHFDVAFFICVYILKKNTTETSVKASC